MNQDNLLFTELNKPSIELYYPAQNIFNEWTKALYRFTVNELEKLAEPLLQFARINYITVIDPNGNRKKPIQLTQVQNKKYNFRKSELLEFLAFFLADARNFGAYLAKRPEKEYTVWKELLTHYCLSAKDIEQITGEKWAKLSSVRNPFSNRNITSQLHWFSCYECKGRNGNQHDYSSYELYFELNPKLYAQLLPQFFPDKCNLKKHISHTLPNDDSLHTFNGETDILAFWPILQSMYDGGKLNTDKDRLTTAVLKKLCKSILLPEFFPHNATFEAASMRTSIVLNLFTLWKRLLERKKGKERPEEMLKQIAHTAYYSNTLVPLLLPHITGFRKAQLTNCYAPVLYSHTLNLLATLPQGVWIDVEAICLQLLKNEKCNAYFSFFNHYELDRLDLFNNKTGTRLYKNNIFGHLSIPYIKGILYIMASFGLAEIAYRDIAEKDKSYNDSLAHIRLTALGAYVLGQTKTYTPPACPKDTAETLFSLDDQHLIIRSLKENNPYESILADMTTPIGKHRYLMSPASFLRNCQNNEEANSKLQLFKQYICNELPPNWLSFFDQIKQRQQRLSKIPEKQYVILKIDSADKELLQIANTDTLIRQYCLRAEKHLLLIDSKHKTDVLNKLKEYGYLL